jgi:Sulfotransferase family
MTESGLDVDQIVGQAMEITGLDDFGEDSWRDGLERLVHALRDEARLNELGDAIAAGALVELLANRLTITEWRLHHPEVASADVVPPIVIIGQARTGTTILYDLLARDPATRAPLTWEVDHPVPPPETTSFDTDPRIDQVDAVLAGVDLLMPGFRTMHPMGARLAQECVSITASDFRSVIFPTQYHVPSYGRWVMYEAEMAPAYRWHRQFLQHLQSRHPAGDAPAERWLIKSPAHIWCLDALLDEYPHALLVQTHRDPLRIIASVCSLMVTLRGMTCDDPTLPEVANEWAEYIVEGLDRSVTSRLDGTVQPDQVVDVQFDAFMADPFATIGAVYDNLGLDLTSESEGRMRSFLAEHRQGEHGTHAYSFADTGLDAAVWRERTRRYQEHFGVVSEPNLV